MMLTILSWPFTLEVHACEQFEMVESPIILLI